MFCISSISLTLILVSFSRQQVLSHHVYSHCGLSSTVQTQRGETSSYLCCSVGKLYWWLDQSSTDASFWAVQGVLLSKLVEDFFNMKEEILSRDFDLGFSGNSEDVVMHALNLLGNCVNVTSTNRNTEFIIAPSNTVPALFELNFYSNGLFHVFISDAVIGTLS